MDNQNVSCKFYLGANTMDGFHSQFDELREIENYRHQYIIKGGPGSGKSTFMRRILRSAESSGIRCEEIRCSSDPDSLDGIILYDLGVSFVDGTAPHVIEPRYAGVLESYIDFSPFWDEESLFQRKENIVSTDSEVKKCYKNAYAHLHCIGLYDGLIRSCGRSSRHSAFLRRIDGLIKRELPKKNTSGKMGKKNTRYLSGFTPSGYTTFTDTVYNMCDRVIGFLDEFGTSSTAIGIISNAAQKKGLDVCECLSPLYRDSVVEHLLIPSLRLGFVSIRRGDDEIKTDKNINLNPYCDVYSDSVEMRRIKKLKKSRQEAKNQALYELRQAKVWHDRLEDEYKGHIDFDGISELTEKWKSSLGL